MSNGSTSSYPMALVPQTGMPPNVVSRSKEILYDALKNNVRFAINPFGPQRLSLSRMKNRW